MRRTVLAGRGNLSSLDEPYPVLRQLLGGRPARGILDAGASDGRWTKRMLRLLPEARAYLFEPNPIYAGALERREQSDERYRAFRVAISDAPGTMTFYETPSPGECSLYRPIRAEVKRTFEVPVTTIDAWAAEEGDPAIEIMKFDIQGGETAALRGGRRTLRDRVLLVYIEVLFNPMYEGGALFADVDAELRGSGFELYNLYSPRCDEHGALSWANAIYWQRSKLLGPREAPPAASP